MIGQTNLLKRLESLAINNNFPRFCILVGDRGSGKKTLAHYVHLQYFKNTVLTNAGTSVEVIRQIIANSYRVTIPTIYLLADADNMSVQAKNALLKVTEEPPNNAYFIMTLQDINNTLDTIKSRATIFYMEQYTPKEILEYTETTYKENNDIYGDLCATPGDVDLLHRVGAEDFYMYVEKVADNIATVNGANVFKIVDKIALKDELDKYDLKMFWKVFISICAKRNNWQLITVTSSAIRKLGIKGINKQMLFDEWILEVRKVWMQAH